MAREKCDLCGRELEPAATIAPELPGQTPAGGTAGLPENYLPCAMIESRKGPLFVCEGCYKQGQFRKYDSEDVYDLHYAFGVEYQALGRLDEALSCLQKAAGIDQTPEVLVMMAGLHGQRGEPEREIAMYERAIKLDPEDVLARRGLTAALRSRRRYAEALEMIDRELKEMGALADLMMERAEVLHHLGQRDAALLAFQAAKAAADSDEDRDEFELRWSRLAL